MESGLNDAIVFYKTSYCTVHIFLLPWLPHTTIEFNDWIY